MPARTPFPLLHVHLGPPRRAGDAGVARLVSRLGDAPDVGSQALLSRPAKTTPLLPRGLGPGALLAVGRALRQLTASAGDASRSGRAERRRTAQWPVPERWPVVHAHGAAALRAVWVAAAWRGSGARLVASPQPGDGSAPPGLWRKAELVAPPAREGRESLARRGVERRRLRILPPGDAAAALRLYRRLADGEARRVQRVDWSVAGADVRGGGGATGARGDESRRRRNP